MKVNQGRCCLVRTNSHEPSPSDRSGMLHTMPSGKPYGLPSVTTPDEKQSPGAVGVTSARIASAMETAVEAALDRPHFLISAPPRVATVGVNSFSNQLVSSIVSAAGRPLMRALYQSGTCTCQMISCTIYSWTLYGTALG